MLALLRLIRGARRVRFDTNTARAKPSQADADLPPHRKRACGPAGLVYTEASLKQSAAIAAP
jgi:hypothetical protein